MSIGPLKETVALWQRLENAVTLEESLRSNKMSGFLIVEDSKEVITTLNKQIDATMADLKALYKQIPSTMTNSREAFKKAAGEVTSLRLEPNPKIDIMGLRDPVKKASKVLADINTLSATIVSACQTITGSLRDLELDAVSPDPLRTLLSNAREKNIKVPDEKKFVAGIKKAWQPPSGFKNAIAGFLGSLGIGTGSNFFGLTADEFAQDLLATSPKDIDSLLSSSAAGDAIEISDEDVISSDELAAAGMEQEVLAKEPTTAEEPATAEKPAAAEKKSMKKWTEISRDVLSSLKKDLDLNDEQSAAAELAFDALKDNPAFKSAVSDTITLESLLKRSLISLKNHEVSSTTLNEMLIQRNNDASTNEPAYDEDDMVRYRWMKMAGLKDGDKE